MNKRMCNDNHVCKDSRCAPWAMGHFEEWTAYAQEWFRFSRRAWPAFVCVRESVPNATNHVHSGIAVDWTRARFIRSLCREDWNAKSLHTVCAGVGWSNDGGRSWRGRAEKHHVQISCITIQLLYLHWTIIHTRNPILFRNELPYPRIYRRYSGQSIPSFSVDILHVSEFISTAGCTRASCTTSRPSEQSSPGNSFSAQHSVWQNRPLSLCLFRTLSSASTSFLIAQIYVQDTTAIVPFAQ